MWQVLAAGDTVPGHDLAISKAVFTQFPVGLYVLDDQPRIARTSTDTRGPRDTLAGCLPAEQSC